jgi:3-keto-5-aminohexanoate cleavage enzyme
MTRPVVLSAAITGGGPARSPHHPVLPAVVLDSALQAWQAGAAILHLHARTDAGEATSDPAAYVRMAHELRHAGCTALLNFSAGDNGGRASREERLRIIRTGAEMVSLGTGSFNAGSRVYDNAPDFSAKAAREMRVAGVRPEVEVFDTGHLHGLRQLLDDGHLQPPVWVNLVFGGRGGMPAEPALLPMLVSHLPPGCEWTVTVQGGSPDAGLRIGWAALELGGHVRTGLEDTSWLAPGEAARSNAELVERWATLARALGRPVATPDQARALVGCPLPARAPQPA